jgi:release factor glutamine methyltransferase
MRLTATAAKADAALINKVGELSRFIERRLQAAGIEESECRAEAEIILTEASGLCLADRLKDPDRILPAESLAKISAVLCRRKEREPLQYCLGETHFYGMRFLVRHGVLIPRADTETLVEAALTHLRASSPAARLAEIGTGSGIISIAILKELPAALVVACDISAAAVELTQANAELNGVGSRLSVSCADWRDWLKVQSPPLDALVANPPYIARQDRETLAPEIRLWEPEQALFGSDEDGLGFYRELSRMSDLPLESGARLFLEIGAGQAEAVEQIFSESRWRLAETYRDLSGKIRVVSCRR